MLDVSAPEGHDPVLAAGDERPVRGVGDLEHGLPVRHVLDAGRQVEGDLQHGDIPAINNKTSVKLIACFFPPAYVVCRKVGSVPRCGGN